MSFSRSRRDLQLHGYRDRFAAALRKRLAPNTSLTVQRFAAFMGASERTVWSWLSGGGVKGEYVIAAMNLFGDSFADEVRGVREETDKELARIEAELARIKAERRAR